MFSRNFPNYSAGFQLNVPIRNRANQADLITDELNYRQSQIQDKQLQNNIKLNVINAQIALKQARAAYETAVAARKLQEQVLAGERRKYELGTSSILNVVIVQRDTTTREIAEVDARSQYIKARTVARQRPRQDARSPERGHRPGQERHRHPRTRHDPGRDPKPLIYL